jgi:hypothetical protein
MSGTYIRLRIQRLVLDGVDPRIGDRLAGNIERELKVLVGRYGVVVPDAERDEFGTVALELDGVTAQRLGRALASIVHERLRA